MNIEQLADAMQKAREDGMVKVGIPSEDGSSREWCWANRVSPTHAKLANCCVYRSDVNFADIVEFREQSDDDGGPHDVMKHFVRVVTRGSTQCEFMYATLDEACDESEATLLRRMKKIIRTLKQLPADVRPICIEGLAVGYGCAAFPAEVTRERAEALVAACPHVFVIEQEE